MLPLLPRCIVATYCILLILEPLVAMVDSSERLQGLTEVDTKLGQVTGRVLPEGVRAFLGIPYALPPVGKLRFEPPVPLASWGGVKLEALEFGDECMQVTAGNPTLAPPFLLRALVFNPDGMTVSPLVLVDHVLDALATSTPGGVESRAPDEPFRGLGSKLPVMTWLYGGGFQQGASSHPDYNGRRMAEKGVVVVSINYRVGALGWMVSVTDNLWGNYGLQDQRLGMEWVHDNIHTFGGDPDRVTLFGESAGAMSIGQHLFMDGAGVLFHQVIMQSNPMGYRFRSVTVANFLGEAMKRGLDCFDLDCLQAEPVSEVLRVQESLMGVPRSVGDFFSWGPVVTDRNYRRHVRKHQKTWNYNEDAQKKQDRTMEFRGRQGGGRKNGSGVNSISGILRLGPTHNYTAPFMNVVQPLEVLTAEVMPVVSATALGLGEEGRRGAGRRGAVAGREGRTPMPVPVMLGVNADEGLMFVHGAFPMTMPKLVYYSFVTALFRTSVVRVLHAYGHLADQCEESGDYRRVMSQIINDYLFRCPTLRAAQLLQEKNGGSAPVFVYQFSHPTEVPGFPECSGSSCHTAELPFVFNNLETIRNGYSYHETSGPAAPSRMEAHGDTYTAEGGVDDSERGGGSVDGSSSDGSNEGDGGLAVIGHILGWVAGSVSSVAGGLGGALAGAARGGFGVGRLFGRGKLSPPLGEQVAGAIVNSESQSVLPESLLATFDEVVESPQLKSSAEGEKAKFKDAYHSGDLDSDLREFEGADGARDAYALIENGDAPRVSNTACGEDAEDRAKLPLSALSDEAPGEEEGRSSDFEDLVSQSTDRGEKVDTVDPLVTPYSEVGRVVEDEVRRSDNDEILVAAEQPTIECWSEGQGNNRATGERGLDGSDCADVAGGVGPQGGKEATSLGGRKRSLGSGIVPPRPTALQAAEADAFVGEAMVTYWATFGKTGDPNSAKAPVLWPAWAGRRLSAQGGAAGSAAMAAMLASGRGGVGKGSFSDVFADAWSQVGEMGEVSSAGGVGWEGGSYFFDIKAEPKVREARRDCLCEFWDRLKYRY